MNDYTEIIGVMKRYAITWQVPATGESGRMETWAEDAKYAEAKASWILRENYEWECVKRGCEPRGRAWSLNVEEING
jgi:hypothetical protein